MYNLTKIGYIILFIWLFIFLGMFIPMALIEYKVISSNWWRWFTHIMSNVIWILLGIPWLFILVWSIIVRIWKKTIKDLDDQNIKSLHNKRKENNPVCKIWEFILAIGIWLILLTYFDLTLASKSLLLTFLWIIIIILSVRFNDQIIRFTKKIENTSWKRTVLNILLTTLFIWIALLLFMSAVYFPWGVASY